MDVENVSSPGSNGLLGDIAPSSFLKEYWQKKPLFIRGALSNFQSPLAPEELAGLACEEGVTARLILEEGGAHPWELRHGPFTEDDFLGLPETHWTLLVQEVDRLVPEAARLLRHVSFLPNWRLDDVMVSYAPDQGTVGPHIDSYDVFLVQGMGRRRWQIGEAPVEEEQYVKGLDVRILDDFTPDQEFVAEPGDVLYLPPRLAHYGVGLGDDCMTYSIGFQAPSPQDLAAGFLNDVTTRGEDDDRFRDAERAPADPPGLLPESDRARIRSKLRALLDDDEKLDRWFGTYATRPRRGRNAAPATPYSTEQVRQLLGDCAVLHRSTRGDFAFIEKEGGVVLFAAGEAYDLPPEKAETVSLITGVRRLAAESLDLGDESLMKLLSRLLNEGALWIEPAG